MKVVSIDQFRGVGAEHLVETERLVLPTLDQSLLSQAFLGILERSGQEFSEITFQTLTKFGEMFEREMAAGRDETAENFSQIFP